MGEFDLINRSFRRIGAARDDVLLGVGDDAALLAVPANQELVICIDTLVSGIHFLPDVPPADLGYKALAVNLSDLAAMGATPATFTLALTLPHIDTRWIDAFCTGMHELAVATGVALVGGDTTRGPLSVTIQAQGWVPTGQALRRDGAQSGDLVCVTGTLGDAALGLAALQGAADLPTSAKGPLIQRLLRPTPRLTTGATLRGVATSCIDLSDGLLGDAGHLARLSGVAIEIELARLPLHDTVRAFCMARSDWRHPLVGGDDYELLFTLPPGHGEFLQRLDVDAAIIGRTVAGSGVTVRDAQGRVVDAPQSGYDHFSADVST